MTRATQQKGEKKNNKNENEMHSMAGEIASIQRTIYTKRILTIPLLERL